jgi:hypothetical protein
MTSLSHHHHLFIHMIRMFELYCNTEELHANIARYKSIYSQIHYTIYYIPIRLVGLATVILIHISEHQSVHGYMQLKVKPAMWWKPWSKRWWRNKLKTTSVGSYTQEVSAWYRKLQRIVHSDFFFNLLGGGEREKKVPCSFIPSLFTYILMVLLDHSTE